MLSKPRKFITGFLEVLVTIWDLALASEVGAAL